MINYTCFVKATHLTFEIYEDSNSLFWPSIFGMIDITKIVQITLYMNYIDTLTENFLKDIDFCFEQAQNLS